MAPSSFRTKIVDRAKFSSFFADTFIRIVTDEDMKKVYNEMYRVLKPKKFVAIVIGNATYSGEEIKTVEFTIDYCEKIGFKLIKNIDKIIFVLCNVMQREKMLIVQK